MNARATSRDTAHPDAVHAQLLKTVLVMSAVVAAASCGADEKSSSSFAGAEPGALNPAGPHEQIFVRFANDDEYRLGPVSDADGRPIPHRNVAHVCNKNGDFVNAYYGPVVAFARDHLVEGHHKTAHAYLVSPGAPAPTLRDGENIVVDPRDPLGELRIISVGPPFYPPGEQWAESLYCLHVQRKGGATTIVVEGGRAWIE